MNTKNTTRWIFPTVFAMVLTGCDGISGTGGPSRVADDTKKQTPADGQAVLGPIIGATVTVRDIENINAVACTTTTADNENLAQAGKINFNEPCIFSDHFYIVTITGGSDVDYDDNGERDAAPTPNTGEFRALLSGEQLLQNDWKTNVLTESVYQALQYSLNATAVPDAQSMLATIDNLATQFIKQDMNGDGVINRFDIAQWHPANNADATINNNKTRAVTQLIHQNLNRTLVDVAATEAIAGHIDTLAPARQVLTYNDNLLVTTDTSLLVYRYQNGDATLLSNLALGWVYDMTIIGNRLYVALGENGIAEIDLGNVQITRRWATHAERLTSLQQHLVFTASSQNHDHTLMTLTDSGDIQQIAIDRHSYGQGFDEEHLFEDVTLLKAIGDVVYWAPYSAVRRFVIRDGNWQEIPQIEPDNDSARRDMLDTLDIEVVDNKAYVIAASAEYDDYSNLSAMYPYYNDKEQWKSEAQAALKRRIYIIDISSEQFPTMTTAVDMADINSLRYIGGEIVGLGATDVSLRDADTMRPKSSLPLPASFSGFDPVKGLDLFRGMIAVAAKENGILLIDPSLIPTKRFYGRVLVDTTLSQASVTVRKFPQNEIACTATSADDGTIAITAGCIKAEAYYRIDVSGGTRNVNGVPVPFAGTVHTIMHKSDFVQLDHQWAISPLTELLWQILSPSINAGSVELNFALDDLSNWWFGTYTAAFLSEDGHPQEIYRWPQLSENVALQFDADRWQNIIAEFATGMWPADALTRLTGATTFMSLDTAIEASAMADKVIVLKHRGSIELLTSQPPFAHLGNINAAVGPMAAQGSKIVSVDERNARAFVYDIADPANAALTSTIALEGMTQTESGFNYCMTTNTLYRVAYMPGIAVGTVSAWRLNSGASSSAITFDYSQQIQDTNDYWCSDDKIVFLRAQGNFDVLQLSSTGLNKVGSIATPANKHVTAVTLEGNRFFYIASDENTSVHFELGLNNNGTVSTVTELNATAETRHPDLLTDLLFSGTSIYLFTNDDVFALDTATLKSTYAFKPPISPHYDTLATQDSVFILQLYRHSFWQFKKPGATQ